MNENLMYGVLALVFLLVGGAAAGLATFWSRRYSPSARALAGRLQEISERRRDTPRDPLRKSTGARQAAWLRWVIRHAPGTQALAVLIQRAGSRHSVAEVMALSAGLGGLAFGLPLVWLKAPWPVALMAGLLLLALPWLSLMQRERSRRLRFEAQLPEALDFMTRALRAGYGLSVAIGMVGDELPDPVASEFKISFDHIKVGMTFGDAMAEMAERINSRDLNFLVIALMIQRKTGGNLTELLTSLAKTVRERIKLKGKVRILASEGKLSGFMIGSLPFVLGSILSLINPLYMSTLWTTAAGQRLMMVNTVMIALGALWMWKIVQIKV